MQTINKETLKTRIDTLEKLHHIEILKILNAHSSIKLNENKKGIFINMSCLPDEVIDEISKYVAYAENQERELVQRDDVLKKITLQNT